MGRAKGQLIFEFIVAAVMFIGIVVFVLNILNANVAMFSGDYYMYSLESKVVAASEALLKTSGGAGLAQTWPVLDSVKVTSLNSDCQTSGLYPELLNNLNLVVKPGFVSGFGNTYNVRIDIRELDGTSVLGCKPLIGPGRPANVSSSTVKRFAMLNGKPVTVSVLVW